MDGKTLIMRITKHPKTVIILGQRQTGDVLFGTVMFKGKIDSSQREKVLRKVGRINNLTLTLHQYRAIRDGKKNYHFEYKRRESGKKELIEQVKYWCDCGFKSYDESEGKKHAKKCPKQTYAFKELNKGRNKI